MLIILGCFFGLYAWVLLLYGWSGLCINEEDSEANKIVNMGCFSLLIGIICMVAFFGIGFGLVSYEKTDTKQYEIIELAPAENGYCAITKNNGKIYMPNYSIKVLEEVEENPHIVETTWKKKYKINKILYYFLCIFINTSETREEYEVYYLPQYLW